MDRKPETIEIMRRERIGEQIQEAGKTTQNKKEDDGPRRPASRRILIAG
jgi:hypothetical protein